MQLHEKLHKSSSINSTYNSRVQIREFVLRRFLCCNCINDTVNEMDSLFLKAEDFPLFDNYHCGPKVNHCIG